jgi:hypothetical protein
MLADYVEGYLREVWRELHFPDENQAAKAHRDPATPSQRSAAAREKATSHTRPNGAPVRSFCTLLEELATLVRNTCRMLSEAAGTIGHLRTPHDARFTTASRLRTDQPHQRVDRRSIPKSRRCS